jgi:DNA processing protein
MDPALRRAILLALNAHSGLSRETICRLALAIDAWAGGAARVTPAWAAAMRVSAGALAAAVALVPAAEAVAAAILDDAAARSWHVIVAGDDDYPVGLLDLPLPPPALFCRGRLPDRPAIAIVGSRAADSYGLEATAIFAGALARAGLVVVSGLARGIDTAAHRAATRDPEGRTVAVLGCGLDLDYPRGSARLRDSIERQGAVLSEFPAGTPALPPHFPIRNRIIAALGFACLVIQAAPRSGSLITARHAIDLGRDVWALPGRIFDSRSTGANLLIRDGASPALDPEQILESLPVAVRDALPAGAADPAGAAGADPARASVAGRSSERSLSGRLLDLLPIGDPVTAETLSRRSGQTVDRVLAALLDLEIEGRVGRLAGSRFVKRASRGARL